MTENKITNPEHLTVLKVTQILSAGSALDLSELKKATEEIKKYNYPAIPRIYTLNKLISELNDRQK